MLAIVSAGAEDLPWVQHRRVDFDGTYSERLHRLRACKLQVDNAGLQDWEVAVPCLQQPEHRLRRAQRPAEFLTERLAGPDGHHPLADDDARDRRAARPGQ